MTNMAQNITISNLNLMKNVTIIIAVSLLISCRENTSHFDSNKTKIDNKSSNLKKKVSEKNNIIENIEIKKFPISDSTNFDNFKRINKLSVDISKKLKLKNIEPDANNFYLNYQIKYFNTFKTIVITAQFENELKTFLINYDNDLNMIDKVQIAYDEIAESLFKTISILTENEIKIEDENFANETITKTITRYVVKNDGKIVKIK